MSFLTLSFIVRTTCIILFHIFLIKLKFPYSILRKESALICHSHMLLTNSTGCLQRLKSDQSLRRPYEVSLVRLVPDELKSAVSDLTGRLG